MGINTSFKGLLLKSCFQLPHLLWPSMNLAMLLMLLYRERQNCLDAERLAPFKRFVCLRQLIINVCVYVCVLGGDMEGTRQDFQTGLCPGSLESSISLQFGDHGVRCCVGITCWCFLICFFLGSVQIQQSRINGCLWFCLHPPQQPPGSSLPR